jgi:integration host factor subunit alpha
MVITKSLLVQSIHVKTSLPKKTCAHLFDSLLEIVKERLENSEPVLISRFGKFCVKENSARRAARPSAGEDFMPEAGRIVVFKPSPVLRDRMK